MFEQAAMTSSKGRNSDFSQHMAIKDDFDFDETDLFGHGLLQFEVGRGMSLLALFCLNT